jgi:hypothetical protein
LQDTETAKCQGCGILAQPLLDALIALEAKARREDLARQYAYLRERLPALDIPAAARAAFCRELSASHGG